MVGLYICLPTCFYVLEFRILASENEYPYPLLCANNWIWMQLMFSTWHPPSILCIMSLHHQWLDVSKYVSLVMLWIFLLMCSLRFERLPWSGETKHNLLGKFLSVQTYSQLFYTIKEKLENTWECGSWTENEPITTQGPYTLFSNQQSTVSEHPSKRL